ncbi:M23 family metallopeptidase [Paenibacillus cremeus]|uniref:M23 family metallopeptidase n=1 Tax=Paenibacillus cremeus TaxID=2163881 RepID=A0A559KCP0_9BACL|nr:M23 family metallopeptidase [Paenibacillus cremeus]TVY09906.1 M23 family metallopeptidase [Paenibacillus cremeus]
MEVVYRKSGFVTMIVPVGTVSAGFGSVDSVHKIPHTGIDFTCNAGDSIYAPLSGVVSRVVEQGSKGLGHGIIIKLNDGKQMVFGHFSESTKLHVGDFVQRGDAIGKCGSSGNSTGNHLHFGLIDANGKFMNPVELFKDIGSFLSRISDKAIAAYTNSDILMDLFDLFQTSSTSI